MSGEVTVDEQDLAALQASNQRMHEELWRIAHLKRDDVRSAATIAAHALAQEPVVAELPRFVPAPLVEALERAAREFAEYEGAGARRGVLAALAELDRHREPLAPVGAGRASDTSSTTDGTDV